MTDPATFRKIQLDSIEDLRFIYENLVKSAREKIDGHLPPSSNGAPLAPPAEVKNKKGTRRSTRNSTGSNSGVVDGNGAGGGEGDPLRSKVEELVMEYIIRTFDLAVPSISINGIDTTTTTTTPNTSSSTMPPPSTSTASVLDLLKTTTDEYEPYDRSLGARVQNLYAEIEEATLRVSRQRRNNPERAMKRYEKALNHEMEKDLKLIEKITREGEEERRGRGLKEFTIPLAKSVDAAVNKTDDGDVVMGDTNEPQVTTDGEQQQPQQVERGERYQEMVRDWERSMGVMTELTKGLPATAHKLERAEAALDYIQEKEKRKRKAAD